MKHLLTLAALLASTLSLAQQMPYNPDANGDDFVGVDDVLGVLGVYDTALMQPDLECDYEGTDLEQLLGGLIAGSLVLDSVYVEYLLIDSVSTYLPECPDPVVVETVLNRSFTISTVYSYLTGQNPRIQGELYYLGYFRSVRLEFFSLQGGFELRCFDDEVNQLTTYDPYAYWNGLGEVCCASVVSLPFPDDWELNENGIDVDWLPTPDTWIHNCQSFRLIPFWHEAE